MWIKGTFLGLWLFGFGTITYLWLALFRHMPRNSVVDVRLISGATSQNPWWWAALIACGALGCALVRSWPGKSSLAVWILLAVTSVVPAGLIGLYFVLLYKLHAAAGAVR